MPLPTGPRRHFVTSYILYEIKNIGKIMDLEYLLQFTSPVSVLTLIVLFLGLFYLILKNRNLPPGPTGVPILGYWPFLDPDTVHLQFQELTKKHGDVFSINVVGKLLIHLGSMKAIKEAHVTKSDCFTERCQDFGFLTIMFSNGLIAANGELWKTLRKFFIQAFKEYGMISVKDYMTGPIYDSVNATIDTLKATNEKPVNIIPILNNHSSGILRRMMFNDSEISGEEVEGILEAYGKILPFVNNKNLLLVGNFAKYFIFPRLPGFKDTIENNRKIEDHLRNIIKRHEETFDRDNIRDMIDGYIKERTDRRDKGDPTAKYFSTDSLVPTLAQFVGDGMLGIAIFIAYFIHELLEHPEEQEKMYAELIEVVGTDRPVTLADKNKLPYTNAFMQEVQRTNDFFAIVTGLECTKETKLNGYRIPKGAITLTNFWVCHRDPKVFDEPEAFKPSRYISEPGKPKAETPINFGVGKRSCAGESFAMMQVFLFLTTIVKNFRLSRPKGIVKKSFLDGNMEVCAHPRKLDH